MYLDTAADYLEEARRMLQDRITPYRYPDDALLKGLQQGVYEAKRLRPDLFLPNPEVNKTIAVGTDDMSWLDQRYREAMLYYVVGHVEAFDSESAQDARAQAFLTSFQSRLIQPLTQAAPPNVAMVQQ